MSTRVVGLLGGTGAGKSTAAAWLRGRGWNVIDADEISRKLSAPGEAGYKAVVAAFGDDVLDKAGRIDRRKLAHLVFSDPAMLEKLEGALHPLMAKRIGEQIAASPDVNTALDCAVLLKPAFRSLADEVWLFTAPAGERAARVMERDNLTRRAAAERIGAQLTEETMRQHADRIFDNSGTLEDLYRHLENAVQD